MTLGEKIMQLRIAANMTQEEMAEKLSVSRQSVSKWEMNQALPQIVCIKTICFKVGDESGSSSDRQGSGAL